MVTYSVFRKIVLSFPEVKELPHFEKTSFRVANKILATYDEKNKRVCIKLSVRDQDVLCTFDKSVLYPVPGKWGLHGWIYVELATVRKEMLLDALTLGYIEVAPRRLSNLVEKRFE